MKPFTKGLWLGTLVGFSAALVLLFTGVMSLSLFMNSSMGKALLGKVVLRPLRFPSEDKIVDLGVLDPDWTLRTLDGEEVQAGRFRGQPMFLNLWATWCLPCVMEMPGIARLSESLRHDGVVFVFVSEEDPEVVRRFVEDRDPGLPVYLIADEVPDALRSEAIPLTLIVDRQGTIVFRHAGAADWDHEGSRSFLRTLAGGPTP